MTVVFYYFHHSTSQLRQGPWKSEHRGQRLKSAGADGVNGNYDFNVTFPEALYQLRTDTQIM